MQKNLLKATDTTLESNDETGILAIKIANHGDLKTITLDGYLTNDEMTLNNITKSEIENLISSLDKSKLVSDQANAKPSDGTFLASEVSYTFSTWSLKGDIGSINWVVTLRKGKVTKTLNGIVSGFPISADHQAANSFTTALKNASLDKLRDSLILASSLISKKDKIISEIKSLASFNSLSASQKALFQDQDFVISSNDQTGELIVTINNHGKSKTLKINGFMTSVQLIAKKISALKNDSLANLNKKEFASKITISQVLTSLKEVSTIKNLPLEIKNLINETNIGLDTNNQTGLLTVTISGYGKKKVLEISGFKTKLEKVKKSKPLASGAIAGIAVGAIFLTTIIGFVIRWFFNKMRAKK